MATPTPTPPVFHLPKLSFELPDSDSSTPNSETTTLNNDCHDSLKESPRSSICSDSDSDSPGTSSSKPPKRVRFQESVCWSYFDVEQQPIDPTPPQVAPAIKPSFWARFKSRNSSGDLDTSPGLRDIKRRNSSLDALSKVTTSSSGRPVLTRRSSSTSSTSSYTVQQPLRESAGRRYDEAHATWRRSAATAKGSWDDLLSNPRQSRLYA